MQKISILHLTSIPESENADFQLEYTLWIFRLESQYFLDITLLGSQFLQISMEQATATHSRPKRQVKALLTWATQMSTDEIIDGPLRCNTLFAYEVFGMTLFHSTHSAVK